MDLIIIILITIISIALIFRGVLIDDDGPIAFGIILFIIVLIFGWLLYGIEIEKTYYIEVIDTKDIEVLKASNICIVVYKDTKIHSFDSKKDYDSIDSTTIFYEEHWLNMYNKVSARYFKYTNDSSNIPEYRVEILEIKHEEECID